MTKSLKDEELFLLLTKRSHDISKDKVKNI